MALLARLYPRQLAPLGQQFQLGPLHQWVQWFRRRLGPSRQLRPLAPLFPHQSGRLGQLFQSGLLRRLGLLYPSLSDLSRRLRPLARLFPLDRQRQLFQKIVRLIIPSCHHQ